MLEPEEVKKEEQAQNKKFSEANEFNHERNQVAEAQKQMASQETTGVIPASLKLARQGVYRLQHDAAYAFEAI